MKLFYPILILLFIYNLAFSQINATISNGEVGNSNCIFVNLNNILLQDSNNFSAKLYIDNSSLFLPKYVEIDTKQYPLDKITIDTFYINTILAKNLDKNIINICGDVLAGNDSVCNLILTDIKLNDSSFSDIDLNFKVTSLYRTLPYYRFASIENIYPNPYLNNNQFSIEIFIDKDDDLTFDFFDLIGNKIFTYYAYQIKRGFLEIIIPIDKQIATGTYYVVFSSSTGNAVKECIILN